VSEPRLSSFSTQRPVAILMLFVAAAVFGWLSLGRLAVNLMPELSYPTITVRTEYPGAAPEEVENDISRPVEEALGVIGGLQRISSVSRAEVSDVVLEFSWNTDISDVTQDVLERLDLVFLPDEAERPLILHFDPSLDPVMELSLSGEGELWDGEEALRRLRRIADLQVKRELEPIEGVAAARVKGGLEEEIHVRLRDAHLRRTGISIQQVIDRLAQENINVAGGRIEEGRTEYLVRTLNEYTDLDEIRETIVALVDGREVRITDLGDVVMAHKERQILTRTDGGESVKIEIYKEADANIVALAQRVKTILGEGEDGLATQLSQSEGVSLQVVADRSLFIESSINEVRNTALLGGLLAVIVLFCFLREFRTTLIVAVSIPLSLLMAFAPMKMFGVSLNIMSLGGLALGIGMLVDSSIVVLESIFRCREEGDDLVVAAVRGTDEVRGAVVASTLTTIAVFLPMVFVEGVAGQAFADLGLAVVVSLLASVMVAIWFIPMLASRKTNQVQESGRLLGGGLSFGAELRRLRSRGLRGWLLLLPWFLFRGLWMLLFWVVGILLSTVVFVVSFLIGRLVVPGVGILARTLMWPLVRLTSISLGQAQRVYPGMLKGALERPLLVMAVFLATVAVSAGLLSGLGSELLPEVRQGEFTVEVQLPVGTPLEETERRLSEVEELLLAGLDGVRALGVTYGFDPAQSERSDEGEHTARFKILLETGSGAEVEDQVVERVRRAFTRRPDLQTTITRPVLFSSKTPIEVEVHGDDLVELRRKTEEVRAVMEALPQLADVQATLRSGAPEIQVIYNRDRLMRYELQLGRVARLVRDKVQGFEATRFNRLDRRIPILVQLAQADRQTATDVEEMVINPGADRPIRLNSVATVRMGEGPSEIRRIDAQRVGLVRANVGEGSLGAAVAAIDAALLEQVDWPGDLTWYISGQSEEWERSQRSLLLALGLSVFLVFVIMAIQFESLLHPLVILFSVPLAFFGSVVLLRAMQIPLSIVVFLGMIMLAGIVVNNAIVLVDYINQLRRRGMPKQEAIITAGEVRLRPILMTTATTVLGLLPMALGLGDGAELRTPMALTVIAGLLSSTLLTLILVPGIYSMVDRIRPVVADVAVEEGVDR
jgi:HAE1 family hydrophobic/amphiphilic exporter-1